MAELVRSIRGPAPVLLIAFNRPDETREVLTRLLPSRRRIYAVVDGPRPGNSSDVRLVSEVVALLSRALGSETHRLLVRPENLGCRRSVESSLSWFFGMEQSGIVLEDDCVPDPSFFSYCDELLTRYRDDPRVGAIAGSTAQEERLHGSASYYFSRYLHVWGWATWADRWREYESSMLGNIPGLRRVSRQSGFDRRERRYWDTMLKLVELGAVDSWAYPWTTYLRGRGWLSIVPEANLVANVGLGESATHTAGAHHLSRPVGTIGQLQHPKVVEACREADEWTFSTVFEGGYSSGERWLVRARAWVRRHRQLHRWVRRIAAIRS